MDDDDETFDGTYPVTTRPTSKARGIDFLILGIVFAHDLVCGVKDLLEGLLVVTASHANHNVDKRNFADAVRADLESIPTTKEE
jgi:hypothetical protein